MYITKQLLAEYTGRHIQTINTWEKNGKITPFFINGKKRFDLIQCFKFIYGEDYEDQLARILPAKMVNLKEAKG